MKHGKLNRVMSIMLSVILMVSLTQPMSVFAGLYDDLDAWKNEGIFTPLTPFTSYEWNEQDYSNFAEVFDEWSNGMEQSYYRMTTQSDVTSEFASQPSFKGKNFEAIVEDAEFEDYKVGFTYHNHDFRSDYDRYRIDVFAMYASEVPLEKHLYVFGIDEDGQAVVLYQDGDNILNGEVDFSITQNDELKRLFSDFVAPKGYVTQPSVPQSDVTLEDILAMTSDEHFRFCSITPWYELQNGWCSDAGMVSQAHIDAAYEYGRTYGGDIDTAFRVTADAFDENVSSSSTSYSSTDDEQVRKEVPAVSTLIDVWGPNLYPEFLNQFDQWASQIGQAYEVMHEHNNVWFNGFNSRDILFNATFEGQSASFLANGNDQADFNSSYIFDVAGLVKSTVPYDDHLYDFTRDRDFLPRVLYLSGEKARNGNLDLTESQNTELNALFQQFTPH